MSIESGEVSEISDQKIPAGTLIADRYRIIKPLGVGGMGAVYLAADTMLADEKIAIKILHANFVHDETQLARFLREVQLMRKINHRNVVRTFDVGTNTDYTYFTMEYVAGIQLESLITDSNIASQEIVLYVSQICEALRAVHAAGIIHRDLKPANILVLKDGTLRVTDFGVARPEVSNLTGHDEIVGSVCYIAPEIWLGKKITHSADLYALGVILYEMLTGVVPFDGNSPAVLMRAHLDRAPRPPKDLEPSVPNWLNKLTLKLLAKSPNDRPKDAKEVIDYLRLHANEGSAQAESSQPFFDELESHTRVLSAGTVFTRRSDTVTGDKLSLLQRFFRPRKTASFPQPVSLPGTLKSLATRAALGFGVTALGFLLVGLMKASLALVMPNPPLDLASSVLEHPELYSSETLTQAIQLTAPSAFMALLQLSIPLFIVISAIGAARFGFGFFIRGLLLLIGVYLGLLTYILSGATDRNALSFLSAAVTAQEQISAVAILSPVTTVYEQIELGAGLVQNATASTALFRSPAAFLGFLFYVSFLAYGVHWLLRKNSGSSGPRAGLIVLVLVAVIFLEGILLAPSALNNCQTLLGFSFRLPKAALVCAVANWFLVFALAFFAAMEPGTRRTPHRRAARHH